MSGRSFTQRRLERRERIIERVQFLTNKMCRADISEGSKRHATMERSALLWALEDIERLDDIAEVLATADDDTDAVDRINAVIESRDRPTDEDRARTPQLNRTDAFRGDREAEALDAGLCGERVGNTKTTSEVPTGEPR